MCHLTYLLRRMPTAQPFDPSANIQILKWRREPLFWTLHSTASMCDALASQVRVHNHMVLCYTTNMLIGSLICHLVYTSEHGEMPSDSRSRMKSTFRLSSSTSKIAIIHVIREGEGLLQKGKIYMCVSRSRWLLSLPSGCFTVVKFKLFGSKRV